MKQLHAIKKQLQDALSAVDDALGEGGGDELDNEDAPPDDEEMDNEDGGDDPMDSGDEDPRKKHFGEMLGGDQESQDEGDGVDGDNGSDDDGTADPEDVPANGADRSNDPPESDSAKKKLRILIALKRKG